MKRQSELSIKGCLNKFQTLCQMLEEDCKQINKAIEKQQNKIIKESTKLLDLNLFKQSDECLNKLPSHGKNIRTFYQTILCSGFSAKSKDFYLLILDEFELLLSEGVVVGIAGLKFFDYCSKEFENKDYAIHIKKQCQ